MMSADEAINVLQRRAFMLQARVIRHEAESLKPASYDRREMRALRRALLGLGVNSCDLPPVPECKISQADVPSALSRIEGILQEQDADLARALVALAPMEFTGLAAPLRVTL